MNNEMHRVEGTDSWCWKTPTGWFFSDECEQPTGPYQNLEHAHRAARDYHPDKFAPTCPEPFHANHDDEDAHRAHHWKERAVCASICIGLHFFLEYGLPVLRQLLTTI